jgi:hypothetical protein
MSPCFEFLIAFKNFDMGELQMYLQKFPDRPSARESCAHFEARVECEGIYFHDIARSDYSAKTFRMLVELALEFSEVTIEGFGVAEIPQMPLSLIRQRRSPQQRTQIRIE